MTYFVNFCVHFHLTDSPDAPDTLNTTPVEHDLIELLADISNQWYEIGLALQVPHNDLENLRVSSDSNIIKLNMVIHSWLTYQFIPITWNTVITAIEGDIVKNKAKANKIRRHLDLPTH